METLSEPGTNVPQNHVQISICTRSNVYQNQVKPIRTRKKTLPEPGPNLLQNQEVPSIKTRFNIPQNQTQTPSEPRRIFHQNHLGTLHQNQVQTPSELGTTLHQNRTQSPSEPR
ncbi:hypothetical protein CHARACLAT_030232 [Characodon lateralis]|uniref:Uncharacterized protein n=1 Tax=Characodon lateralis TaxID=208331 RepID=A0ABU7ER85_9TELE|nr:hypothetical protein [Characodon lateralis]